MLHLVKKHFQFIKFLMVGGYNTIFGYACFALLFFLFPQIHYLWITFFSNLIGTLNAFIAYKYIVFKTKGGHLREYMKIQFCLFLGFPAQYGPYAFPGGNMRIPSSPRAGVHYRHDSCHKL